MKNTIIGFLMATCMFLMIGGTTIKPEATDEVESIEMFVEGQVVVEASENGRYQGWSVDTNTMHMIDTRTGELYRLDYDLGLKNKKWKRVSSSSDWIKE